MLFLITTAVMSINATEDVRRQRRKILPVSLMMLIVATMVGAVQRQTRTNFLIAFIAHRPLMGSREEWLR